MFKLPVNTVSIRNVASDNRRTGGQMRETNNRDKDYFKGMVCR